MTEEIRETGETSGEENPEINAMTAALQKMAKESGEKPQQSAQAERVKSPEELKFEGLAEEFHRLNILNDPLLNDPDAEKQLNDFLQSEDPEKVAIVKLREAASKLAVLQAQFYASETAKEEKDKEGWMATAGKNIAFLEPIFKDLGLVMPRNQQEAKDLKPRKFLNFENWQKLAEALKAKEKEEEK